MHPHDVPTVRVDDLPSDAVLLDVREDAEWQAGHIDGAVHIPMNEVPQRLTYDAGPVTTDAAVVVVCKVGGRSAQVTAWLRQQGYGAVNSRAACWPGRPPGDRWSPRVNTLRSSSDPGPGMAPTMPKSTKKPLRDHMITGLSSPRVHRWRAP